MTILETQSTGTQTSSVQSGPSAEPGSAGNVARTAIDFGLYDADEHYYEPADAIHRHLPRSHRNAVRWIDIDGRKTLLIRDKLLSVVPNPTYDPVGAPGTLEIFFRSQNQAGREMRDLVRMQPMQPEYQSRDARLAVMSAQGVDFTWLLPSLGLGLEEMLCDDPDALNAVFTSYNEWLHDDWGYDRDGRIQTGPLLPLVDPVWAEAEIDRIVERGAKFVTMRPAPIRSRGISRTLGDPAHDRIWAKLAEAGVIVAFHAADSGYGRTLADWGESGAYTGHKGSPFGETLAVHIERPIFDTMASLVCHGVFDRHPTLRVVSLELGSGWVPYLVHRFKKAYGKVPQLFGSDPVESFREHVWIAPFYEDEVIALREDLGADHILLGSDWPHPEGLETPLSCYEDFVPLGPTDVRLALRDNLKKLVGH
jgi:predicted TIM-barrel fold metal-dependent hydrolase